MQSCWKELTAIHTALNQTNICSIDSDSWHRTISQALSALSARDSFQCHVAPDMCQHCHQLMAMSAIVTMTLLAKKEKNGKLEEMYLLPLLQGDLLHRLVRLLQHSCQFLRYQVRRALVTILSLHHLKEAPVQYITQACVRMVLHQSAGSPLSLEPLQLLCGMLSRRSAASLSVEMSGLLHPHLAALYKHCCQPVINGALQIKAESSSVKNSTLTQPNITDENSVSGKSEVLTFFLEKAAENQLAEENSSVESPLKRVKISTDEKIPFTAHSVTAGTLESVQQISVKNDTEGEACSANYDSHLQDSDNLKSSSFVCEDLQRERDTSFNSADPEAPILGFIAPDGGDQHSSQTEMIHYMFLCLLQKVVKLVSSLEETERTSQLLVLNDMILTRLVSDHTRLFSRNITGNSSECLLVKRKFLDILDTVLDYTSIRTSRKIDTVYEQIAVHFVHSFQASNCSWLFPSQHTFIGGRCDKERETGHSGLHSHQRSMVENTGEMFDQSRDENCSPLLLLLVTIVLKSCAIVFKTQQKGQAVTVCSTLLCTMHHHLHHQFNRQSIPESRVSDLPSYLDWLPQVCSDQDDRWMETLLCTLDIYLQAQQQCTDTGDAKMLMKLLAPHGLFIQMLYLTHFNASLLIDWLTSPETCFLAYLTRYLRLVAADFPEFCLAAATWNPMFPSQSSSVIVDDCRSMGEVQPERSGYVRVYPEQNRDEVLMSGSESSDLAQTLIAHQKRSRSPSHKTSDPLNQHERSESQSHSDYFPDLPVAASENSGSQTPMYVNVTATQSNRATTSENITKPSLGLVLLSGYDDGSDDSSSESCDEREPHNQSSMDDAKLISQELDEDRKSATAAQSKSGVDHEEAVCNENTAINIHSNLENCDTDYSDDDGQDENEDGYEECDDDDDDDDSDGNDQMWDIAAKTDLADNANPIEQVLNLTPHSLQSDSSANLDWHLTETQGSSVTHVQVKQKHIPRHSQSKKRADSDLTRGETRKDSEEDYFSRVMHLLIAVRQRLQRLHRGGLLVYNPTPLVSLIQRCEGLYHSMYSE